MALTAIGAAGVGASSRTMLADLPPSSRNTFFTVSEALAMMRRPVAVDPVKVIMSTRGSVVRTSPTRWSDDATTLTTPAGMSVSSAMSRPSKVADHGVSGAGLSTTVLPAARAGPSLARFRLRGKFHGVMAPTTPTASRRISRRWGWPKTSRSGSQCSYSYRTGWSTQ